MPSIPIHLGHNGNDPNDPGPGPDRTLSRRRDRNHRHVRGASRADQAALGDIASPNRERLRQAFRIDPGALQRGLAVVSFDSTRSRLG